MVSLDLLLHVCVCEFVSARTHTRQQNSLERIWNESPAKVAAPGNKKIKKKKHRKGLRRMLVEERNERKLRA